MSSINKESVRKLEETVDKEIYSAGVSILLKLLDNVIREPHTIKYRKIRLENKTIKDKVLCLSGAQELLHQIGFEENDGELSLSMKVLIATVKNYRDFLRERLDIVTNAGVIPSTSGLQINVPEQQIQSSVSTGAISKKPNKIKRYNIKPFAERIHFPKIITFRVNYLIHLEETSDQMRQYEDEHLQELGRQSIPIGRLTENVLKNMRRLQKQIPSKKINQEDPCFKDWFLVELTRWFKEEFFTWVNSLPCKVCGIETGNPKRTFIDEGVRVEAFKCCNTTTKFYRYNDVVQLLRTRKGRCGEYANCFTFLCRCMGYEARYVQATFDHVWTEVYSVSKKKWIHVDPSDNVLDSPLIYEHGWKRTIDYVIAYSRDDIQDVTWRYSSDHEKIKQNRIRNKDGVNEENLLKTITLIREKRQAQCSEVRKRYLVKRALMELVDLMTPKQPTEDEKKGRSSGSLSWRLQRGEEEKSSNLYIFSPLPLESASKQFNLRYSCSQNKYERFLNDGTVIDQTSTWEFCTFSWENVQRKVEQDWKMVYLSRAEDTNTAQIEWKFDFSKENLKIQNISLVFDSSLYENGEIDLEFISGGQIFKTIQELNGSNEFIIKASLKGGKGDCAWQHTQLFRQSIHAVEFPFILNIKFDK